MFLSKPNSQKGEVAVVGSLSAAVSKAVGIFGAAVKPRLASKVGEPEDQIRGPLEVLLTTIAAEIGVEFTPVGEASLADLKVRPDYAAKVNGAVSGYIEVKRPGKGADTSRWTPKSHDGRQWEKLKSLPNVLYTDGECWGLYHSGERFLDVVRLSGDITTAGSKLTTSDDGLARLLTRFLNWKPIAPRRVGQLVRAVAPLTRLLRDEVVDTLKEEGAAGAGPFTRLAEDWRHLLFPEADDFRFADGYAQSVAFALLLARTAKIDFEGKSVAAIALELGKSHSLLGKALSILTDESIGALTVTLDTLVRVISAVDFERFAEHAADPYLALYEHFLAEYDPELRRHTGSYYTPAEVVSAMTRLTDDVLRTRLNRSQGLATEGVTIIDPAMGTGAFVLDVLETVARTVRDEQGLGAVPARLRESASRVAGIEIQTGPYAVAELRVAEALSRHGATVSGDELRLYVADTLDDPFAVETQLAATLEPIALSRRRANTMKAEEPVLVVIGNPPYRQDAAGLGGFVEDGAPNSEWVEPLLADFKEPGTGRFQKDLANLYVYFWRWATWKVFDAHPKNTDGVICFITTSGYLKGQGFAGMRRYMREHASEGWVIDCTPEGHQPDVATRIFGGVQQPIAIGIFVRRTDKDPTKPAPVKYISVHGKQAAKFDALESLGLDDDGWEQCPDEWTAPFLPGGSAEWDSFPALEDLIPWHQTGLAANRTWVFAPSSTTLHERWKQLVGASGDEQRRLFRETDASAVDREKPGLKGFPHLLRPIAKESGPCLEPVAVAYRSFDLQYVIPDDRLMHRPRPDLWRVRGDHQIYLTMQHAQSLTPGGPAATFAAETPEMDHFNGRGGKVLPLYAGPDMSAPNLSPGLLSVLSATLGSGVTPEDVFAYVAAVTAHPAFIERFAEDFRTPGVRIPLTADAAIWKEAVALGHSILWLHTRGQRAVDPAASRPSAPPRVDDPSRKPLVLSAIPDTPDRFPDELIYDPDTETLAVGEGRIGPVSHAVAAYEVSGMNVLRKWFGYRRKTRPHTRGAQSLLDDVRPTEWPSGYTTDLLDLLHVLTRVTDLESAQADLLDRLMAAPLVTVSKLTGAGVLPVPQSAKNPLKKASQSTNPTLPLT